MRAGFEAQLCHLLGVQPWTTYLSKLNLSFLICRMDVAIGSAELLGGVSAICICEVLNVMPGMW